MSQVKVQPMVYFNDIRMWSNRIVSYILTRAKTAFSNRFLRNAGWLGSAELANRITRLLTAVVLARFLSPIEFGVAAVALTANELVKVLAQNGIGAKIIQAKDHELDDICHTAYKLNWIFCSGLFITQCVVAILIGVYYQRLDLTYMVGFLAIVYLIIPFALVQAFLIQRQKRLHATAIISSGQITIDNLLTALFAVLGLGIWSIIIPKVLVAPIWVFGTLSQQKWSRQPGRKMKHVSRILHFGKNILGGEVTKVIRLNVDNIVVASFLGLEAAGIYYFAKNAGLGISLSLISAFNLSLFTHLCEFRQRVSEMKTEFYKATRLTALVLIPIISMQALLAQWYVPVIFGEEWRPAIPVIVLLCLSAIPRPIGEGASELLKAMGHTKTDFRWNILFSIAFMLAIFIGLYWGIVGVATAILIVHLLLPLYCRWTIKNFLMIDRNISQVSVSQISASQINTSQASDFQTSASKTSTPQTKTSKSQTGGKL